MTSPRLDRQIKILALASSRGADGGVVEVWTEEGTAWAGKVESTGGEPRIADARQAEATEIIAIRYRPTLSERNRFVLDGRAYDVTHIKELGRRRFQIVTGTFAEGRP